MMKVLYVGTPGDKDIIDALIRRVRKMGFREESVVSKSVVNNNAGDLTELEGIDAVVLVGKHEIVFRTEEDYIEFLRAAHEQGFVAAVRFDPSDILYRNRYIDWTVYFNRSGNKTLTDGVVIPLDQEMLRYYRRQWQLLL